LNAANRDEAINGANRTAVSPEVFDVGRSPNQHLAFGAGIHRCLGALLASIGTRIALQAALPCLPELELDAASLWDRCASVVGAGAAAPFRFDYRQAGRVLAAAARRTR
jgi:cytochrome P450